MSNGSPWTIECSAAAARVGAVDVLQWAEDRGLPIASVFAQDAARQHARRLFALLGMEEVDPDMLREFLERRAAAATAQFTSAQISDNLIHVPDLETTVLTFFRGADNLDDDEHTVSAFGPRRDSCIGVSEEQLLGAVNTRRRAESCGGSVRAIGTGRSSHTLDDLRSSSSTFSTSAVARTRSLTTCKGILSRSSSIGLAGSGRA